jgi:hypothetical protein
MFNRYCDYVKSHPNLHETIFVHNLGSFDGVLMYPYLMSSFGVPNVELIDDKNKLILIKARVYLEDGTKTITWKDSYRIFPVSLDKLCEQFGVPGKTSIP